MSALKAGEKYRHYKGGEYEVVLEAPHVAGTTMVVYKQLSSGLIFIRDKVEFLGLVAVSVEKTIPRFDRIS